MYTWPDLDIWLYSWPNVHLTIALTGLLLFIYVWYVILTLSCIFFHHMYKLLCMCTFPFYFNTHWAFSDDPEFAHPNIGCFILLFRCSIRLHMLRGTRVSLFLIIGISALYSCYLLILLYRIQLPFSFFIHLLSCVVIYMLHYSVIMLP